MFPAPKALANAAASSPDLASRVSPSRFVLSETRCRDACTADTASNACAYRVAWSINPHMRIGAVDPARAVRQHDALVAALRAHGAEVELVPFVHGAYDSVFSKDNALLVERDDGGVEVLLAHPRHPERQAEQRARARAYVDAGMRVIGTPRTHLEGGDVVVLPPGLVDAGDDVALLGHGFRSDRDASGDLARFLDGRVLAMRLVDPRLYHLDMAVTVLSDGTVVACKEALAKESFRALAEAPWVRTIVPLSLEEALRFGANLVEVGDHLVGAGEAPNAFAALRREGWSVTKIDLGEFHLAGGSAACLVSRVHVPARALTCTTRRSRKTGPGRGVSAA